MATWIQFLFTLSAVQLSNKHEKGENRPVITSLTERTSCLSLLWKFRKLIGSLLRAFYSAMELINQLCRVLSYLLHPTDGGQKILRVG